MVGCGSIMLVGLAVRRSAACDVWSGIYCVVFQRQSWWRGQGRAGCLCRVHRALLLIFGAIHPNCAAVFAIGQDRFSGYIERIVREVGLRWRPEVLINSIFPAP